MAQELLATFAEELASVTLTPDVIGGIFEIRLDGEMIWSRKDKRRFPDIKEIKRLVRDRIAPGRRSGIWTSRSDAVHRCFRIAGGRSAYFNQHPVRFGQWHLARCSGPCRVAQAGLAS